MLGNTANGLWMPQSPEELFEQSDTVFVGTIKSVNVLEFEKTNTYNVEEDGKSRKIVENCTQTLDEYAVSIEEFLKNPLESSEITLLEATVGGVPGRNVSIGGYEIGDRVLFYVPKLDGTNQYSPESFKNPETCDAKAVSEKPRIIGVNDFKTIQNDISLQDNFMANHPIEFVFDKDMRTLDGNEFEISVGISRIDEDRNRQIIFEKTIPAESSPCEWIATAKWDVTLDEGKYRIDMHEAGDLRANTSSMNINVVANNTRGFTESLDLDPVADLWDKHSEIIDGIIVSKTTYPGTGKGPTEFHVKVNKFFKPLSKNTESITLFASYADSDIPSILNGDRALIYIESGNQISKYSVRIDESTYCEPRDYIQIGPVLPNEPNQLVRGAPMLPFDWKDQCLSNYFTEDPNFWHSREYRPPMQQWKIHNIPIDKQRCSGEGEDFISIQKDGNSNYKYCVKPESISKLIERGWAKQSMIFTDIGKEGIYELQLDDKAVDVRYSISGSVLESIEKNSEGHLDIKVGVFREGHFTITIPSDLIGNSQDWDENYVVLLNGEEVAYDKKINAFDQTLKIPLYSDTEIVQIIKTYPISDDEK